LPKIDRHELGQDELERGLVEIFKRRYDRKPADKFRDQAILEQVFRLDVAEDLALLSVLEGNDLGAEATRRPEFSYELRRSGEADTGRAYDAALLHHRLHFI
jgi:hypothetical protein